MANSASFDPTDPVFHKTATALDHLARDMPRLGIALSGGGDSMALLHLARHWAGPRVLMAATVDHGLRPEAAAEARAAGQAAAGLGITHQVLPWRRDSSAGNLMAAARQARLQLMADWARRHDLSAVLLGHTRDDQAETLVMRLARGAGIDGLSGMAPARQACGMVWLRPLLAVSRQDLRHWLVGQGIGWIDDPSNLNEDYERVRVRKALATLDLPAAQLAHTAANLAMARDALQVFAHQTAEGAMARHGALHLPLARFRAAPPEIRRRLLVAGLRWVNGAPYPARRDSVLHLLGVLQSDGRATLDGVIAQAGGGILRLLREPSAAAAAVDATASGAQWDRRWQVHGLPAGLRVAALGHAVLPGLDWRAHGLTHDEAAALPGLWSGPDLIAAPMLQSQPEPVITPLRGISHFHALLYTH